MLFAVRSSPDFYFRRPIHRDKLDKTAAIFVCIEHTKRRSPRTLISDARYIVISGDHSLHCVLIGPIPHYLAPANSIETLIEQIWLSPVPRHRNCLEGRDFLDLYLDQPYQHKYIHTYVFLNIRMIHYEYRPSGTKQSTYWGIGVICSEFIV